MEEDIDGDLADLESLNYDDLDNVSKLQKSQRYSDIMQVSSHESFPYHFGIPSGFNGKGLVKGQ